MAGVARRAVGELATIHGPVALKRHEPTIQASLDADICRHDGRTIAVCNELERHYVPFYLS